MQRLQLYIEGELVDLFKDETVELNSTIQDIRDIGKVFTDYSQNFNVPASDTNNKIFRHYYNYNITGNAYDSRQKKQAEIHINYMPFRRGKIFLNGVKMKMNKPYAYDLTFYGNTVSLKDLIGDYKLSDLSGMTFFQSIEHNYDNETVKGAFETGISYGDDSSALIYPLISAEKRLFYHSDATSDSNFFNSSGNLYVDGDSDNNGRGLEYTDLKPAVKCKYIIDAIEERFPITFTDDFFENNDAFSNLYMWLSREKGNIIDYFVESDTGLSQKIITKLTGFTTTSSSETMSDDDLLLITKSATTAPTVQTITCSITPDDSNNSSPYTIKIIDTLTNELVASATTTDGSESAEFNLFQDSSTATREYSLKFVIENFNASATFTGRVVARTSLFNPPNTELARQEHDANDGNSITPQLKVTFDLHLPEMKIIDFLTGLFKMFNLTAYYIDDRSDSDFGKIYVDTLDNFYSDAVNNPLNGLIDIDKYLDITEHQVNSTLPFKRINFEFKETNSILMSQHLAEFGEVFGNSEYIPEEVDFGSVYEIKLPFSHLKYERLLDLNDESDTLIQWGYAAGGSFDSDVDATPAPTGDYDPIKAEALLFYGIRETNLPDAIAFRNGNNTTSSITNYWRPSNSNEDGNPTTPPSHTINFDIEVDEWQGINYGQDTNSLFQTFYSNYVEGIFNVAKRLFIVTAYLPPNILVNYRMNDQIKIQDKVFRINSITTNLNTGKTKLELLNIFSNEIVE